MSKSISKFTFPIIYKLQGNKTPSIKIICISGTILYALDNENKILRGY